MCVSAGFAGGLLTGCCSNPEFVVALLAKRFPTLFCVAASGELGAAAAVLLSVPTLAALKLVEIC